MFRFAFAVFLAALAGASLIDLVADTLNRAFIEPAGLLAIAIVPSLVALAFTVIALAAGQGKRAPKPAAVQEASGKGDLYQGGALNPEGPVVLQLRELCRADTRHEIANQRASGDIISIERAQQIARGAVDTERRRLETETGKRPRVSKGWPTGQNPSLTVPVPQAA